MKDISKNTMKSYRQSLIKKNLELRAQLIQSVRQFFKEKDYLEVETPHRIPAPAPETHMDAQESDGWFLHTSPEMCMKRLLAAGFSRLFQICRCFRKNERGGKHLPEFTMLEWYGKGDDYQDIMDQCEDLIRYVADIICVGLLCYQGETINLLGNWPRMTVSAAFQQYASVSMEDSLTKDRFDEIMVSEIEPNLGRGRPLFLYDYPASRGALARLKPQDPRLSERFELYICGIELCNGFSELNDPIEQRLRFEHEQAQRRLLGKSVYPMPETFLESLAEMPPAGGNALGLDRLVMLFANATQIDDVIAFIPEEL